MLSHLSGRAPCKGKNRWQGDSRHFLLFCRGITRKQALIAHTRQILHQLSSAIMNEVLNMLKGPRTFENIILEQLLGGGVT